MMATETLVETCSW